jgi:hypothetical protein
MANDAHHGSRDMRRAADALNRALELVYGSPARVSGLLLAMGFDERQVQLARTESMAGLVAFLLAWLDETAGTYQRGAWLRELLHIRIGISDRDPAELARAFGVPVEHAHAADGTFANLRSVRVRVALEVALRAWVVARLGEPPAHAAPLPSVEARQIGRAERSEAQRNEEPRQPAAAAIGARIDSTVVALVTAHPGVFRAGMAVHVLFGSRGPVVDALVAQHCPSLFAALADRPHSEIRACVRALLEDGRIRLDSQQRLVPANEAAG